MQREPQDTADGMPERVYLPKPTLALLATLLLAGVSAGAAGMTYTSQTRATLTEMRTDFRQGMDSLRTEGRQNFRELKQELCLLRSQLKANGYTGMCSAGGAVTLASWSAYLEPASSRPSGAFTIVLLALGGIAGNFIFAFVLILLLPPLSDRDRQSVNRLVTDLYRARQQIPRRRPSGPEQEQPS